MDTRAFLVAALRDVIAGGDITFDQLDDAIRDDNLLRGDEMKAYWGLRYWASDADIRAKDPAYAPMRREGLARLLARLENK